MDTEPTKDLAVRRVFDKADFIHEKPGVGIVWDWE
jgi:hypothetical protein